MERLLSASGSPGPAGRATRGPSPARGFQKRPSVLCGAHRCQAAAPRRLEFPTYTNSPALLKHAPNRHLCWLRQYFPFIAVMRVNIFPEITSEKCAWILNTCDPDIRGERLFKTHTHTCVPTSMPCAPRTCALNRAACVCRPKAFPGACAPRGRIRGWRGGRGPGGVSRVSRWPCIAAPRWECPSHEPGMDRMWFLLPHPWPLPTKGSGGDEGSG